MANGTSVFRTLGSRLVELVSLPFRGMAYLTGQLRTRLGSMSTKKRYALAVVTLLLLVLGAWWIISVSPELDRDQSFYVNLVLGGLFGVVAIGLIWLSFEWIPQVVNNLWDLAEVTPLFGWPLRFAMIAAPFIAIFSYVGYMSAVEALLLALGIYAVGLATMMILVSAQWVKGP